MQHIYTQCDAGHFLEGDTSQLIKKFNVSIEKEVRSRDSSVGIATGYELDDQGEREFEFR
jgi:hypothetical protein